MFRRSRLSVRPKLSTIGRTGASQEPPPSNEDSAKANIEAETPVSATDTKLADEQIKQTPGDSNEQHGETAAASAIQRRKRFSVKPKVLPGRPSALPRTPKSPIKPTLPPVKSPAPVIDKADAAIEENSTAPQQEILPSEDSRLPTTNDVLPLEGSGKNVHKPDETVNIQPCNKGKEISPKTASVPRSIPDREAIEISEKAKTLMSKANLAASSQQFSLSQLLNDKSDLVRLEKARKLRQLLKQEMLKGKTKKAKSNVKEHCLDPSKMTMRDLIRYLPTANPMSTSLESQQENETVLPPSPAREASPERAQEAEVQPKKFSPSLPEPMDDASAAGEEQQQEEEEAEEEDREDEDAVMVPQVKVAEDGSLIIDEESLTVEVQRMKGPNTIQDRDPIFERGSTTTYSSFRKGTHTKPWSTEETDMFFLAINMVGTDFSMICQLFPHRARTEIKNKFKKEERHNAWRIDKAFRERRRLDLEYFKKLLQKIIEYQESKKKLKAISEKEKAPRKRKRKSGKKETISLSDVEEEAEDISNEEQEGEKENLCNKTTSDSRSKRKRKDKDDPSPDSKAEKKKRKNMPDDEAIPAEMQQEDVETPESDKSTEATLLGRKARKAPKSKAILLDKGESTSDETVEAQIIVHSPKTTERLSDNDSDQEVTVLNSKPTRSGRISKPVQSLNYPAKEDRHSSASESTLTSPGRDTASKRKSKTQGKRRTAQKQATKESKKPTLITLRASQSEESDDDEEEAHAPHWDEENSKDAFVPASLCSPKPVVGDVEETMEELLPHDMPDVLGLSTNALFPDELEPNESGSLEPCEHQLDLLVDVIDFLSEHTEASEDEAAQTLLAIGNVSNVAQLTDRQASELDHTSSIESNISIDVDDTSISFQLEEYNESLQPSTVEISQTAEFPAPHTSNKSEEESCSTQEKSPPPKKGRFAKIKPKPNLGSRATKTVCVKETKPVKLETTATSQPKTLESLESRQDEPEPSQTENRSTNNTLSLMPSPQTGYEPCEVKETTVPPIQKVTPETTMPAKEKVTPETTMPPIQTVTPETTMPSTLTVTAETTMPPIQRVTAETTMPPTQTVTAETTMPPIQRVTAETTMPPTQTVTAETTMPPIQRVTAETTMPPTQTVTAETTMPPIQRVTAETTMPPIQKATPETTMPAIQKSTPETTMPPIQKATPETTMPPIQKATPETTMPAIQKSTPETTMPPIQKATPETTVPPIQKATPETTMSPIQKVTLQTTMSRIQTLMPETTMPPKQKVTLETTSSPKQKATLETTFSPKQKVTLDTTLSPKEKVIPDTAMPPKQTETSETTLSPIQKVTPQTTMSHVQTVTPETTMPPKQKVTLETTSSTKQKVTPETAMPPKEKVTPETPLSPKQTVIPETTLSPKQTVTPETTLSPKGKVTPETSLSPEQKVTPETSLSPKQTETAESSTEPSLVCDLGTSKQTVEAVCDDITTTIPSLKSQEESTSPVLEQSINKNEAVRLTNEIPEVKSSEIKPSDDTCSLQETTAAPELPIQSSKTSALPRKGRLPKIKPKPNIGRSSRIKSAVDPEEKINLECVTAVTSEAQPAPVSVSESVLVSRKDSEKQTDPGSNSGSETDLGHVKEKCVVTPSAQCVETQQEPVKAVGETMKAPELGNNNSTQTDRSSEEEKTDKPAPQSNPDSESSKLGAVQRRRWIPKVKPKLVSLPRTTKSKVGAQDNSLPIGELVEPTSTTSHSASSKPDTETGIKDAVEAQQTSCSLNSTTTDLISPALPESISTPEKMTAELKSFSVNFEMVDKITEAYGSNQTSVESRQLVQRSPSDSVNVHQAEGNTYENQGISQSRDSEPPEPQNTEAAAASKTFDYQHVFTDMLPDQVPSDPDEPFFILSLTEIPFCPSGGAMEAQQRNPVEPVLPPATGVNVSLSDIYIPTPEKAALGSDLIRVEEYLPSAPFVDISILEEPQANPSRRTLILAEAEDNSKDNIAEASLTESHPPVKGLSETKLTGKAAAKEVNECSDKAEDVPETTAHEESPSLTSETTRKPSETKGRKRQTRNTKATRDLQKEHSETQSSKTMTSSSIKDQLTCFSSESSDLIELEEGPTNVSESFYSNVFTTVDEANPGSTTKDSAGPGKSRSKPVETKATRKKQRKEDSSIESSSGRKDSLTEDSTALASSNLQENQTSLPKRAIGSSKKDNAPGKRTGKSKSSNEVESSRLQRTRVSVKSTDALSLDPLPSSSSTVAVPTQESNQQSSECSSSEPQVSQQSDSFDGSLSEEAPTNVTQFFIGDIFTEVTNDDGPAAELEAQAAETIKTQNRIAKASDDSLSGHSSSTGAVGAAVGAGAGAGAEAAVGAAIGAGAEAAVGAAPSVECLTSLIQKAPDPSKSKAIKTRGKGSKKTNKSTSSEAQPQDQPLTSCGAPKISGSDKEPTPVSQPLAGASLTEVEKTQAQTTQGKSRQKRIAKASDDSLSGHSSSLTEAEATAAIGAAEAAVGAAIGAGAEAAVGAAPSVECLTSLIQKVSDPSKSKDKKTRGKGSKKTNKSTSSEAQPQDQPLTSCGAPKSSGSKNASSVSTLSDKEPTPVSQPLAGASLTEVEKTQAQTTQGKLRQKRKTRASSGLPSLEPSVSTEEQPSQQTEPQSESKVTRGKQRNKKPTVGTTARRSRPQSKSTAELAPPQTSTSGEPPLPIPDQSDANEGFDDEPISVSQYFLTDVFTEVDDKL